MLAESIRFNDIRKVLSRVTSNYIQQIAGVCHVNPKQECIMTSTSLCAPVPSVRSVAVPHIRSVSTCSLLSSFCGDNSSSRWSDPSPCKGSGSETTLIHSLPVRSSCPCYFHLIHLEPESSFSELVDWSTTKLAISTQQNLLRLSMSSNWLSYDRYNRHIATLTM